MSNLFFLQINDDRITLQRLIKILIRELKYFIWFSDSY